MVDETRVHQLMALGLSKYEACAYLALLGYDESSAVEVAGRAGVPRQRIYDVLASLSERNLVVAKNGRPTRYTAQEPGIALRMILKTRRRQQQTENERLTALVEMIVPSMELLPQDQSLQDGRSMSQTESRRRKPVGGL
jgi:sugar-specific transcriptional regulator TrmB